MIKKIEQILTFLLNIQGFRIADMDFNSNRI